MSIQFIDTNILKPDTNIKETENLGYKWDVYKCILTNVKVHENSFFHHM